MRELLGKVITKVQMFSDTKMVVTTNDGEFVYETEGDCCSTSWFAHITNISFLLGEKVNWVVEKQEFTDEQQKKAEAEKRNGEYGSYDCLALYGILLKTNKGTCEIEFRNDSNGYYGGYIENSTIYTDEKEQLKTITEDF